MKMLWVCGKNKLPSGWKNLIKLMTNLVDEKNRIKNGDGYIVIRNRYMNGSCISYQ